MFNITKFYIEINLKKKLDKLLKSKSRIKIGKYVFRSKHY